MDTVAADYLAITRFGGNNIEIFAVMYPRLSVIDANDQKASGAAESFLFDGAGQFFAVKTPQGIRLTREGAFTLNDEGKLVNKQGYEVLSTDKTEITFNPQDSVITIDKNGQAMTNVPGTTQMVANKKLLVVEPQNLRMLKKEGENLYVPDPADPLKPKDESGSVMQGFTEKSNVNAVNEMIALVEANRLVGMYQKAMDSQMNDLNRDAIEKLAVTRR